MTVLTRPQVGDTVTFKGFKGKRSRQSYRCVAVYPPPPATKRVAVWLVWYQWPVAGIVSYVRALPTYGAADALADKMRRHGYLDVEITGPHYPKVSA